MTLLRGGPGELRITLDANVYVDSAAYLGPQISLNHLPTFNPPFDAGPLKCAAQTLAAALSGQAFGTNLLVPCISDHIEAMVFSALVKPISENGLEWEEDDADQYLDELYAGLAKVNAIPAEASFARHSDLLGDEDGKVFSTALESESRILVTSDGPFLVHASGLQGIVVMRPREFLERLRKVSRNN